MAMIVRYRVEDFYGKVWDGEDFVSEELDGLEFRTEEAALEAACEAGDGYVERYQRYSTVADVVLYTAMGGVAA
jgi:hypothetical protein